METYWWLLLLAILMAANSNRIHVWMTKWIPDGKKRARAQFWIGGAQLAITGIFTGMAVSVIWPRWAAVVTGLVPVGVYLLAFFAVGLYIRKKKKMEEHKK